MAKLFSNFINKIHIIMDSVIDITMCLYDIAIDKIVMSDNAHVVMIYADDKTLAYIKKLLSKHGINYSQDGDDCLVLVEIKVVYDFSDKSLHIESRTVE